MTKTSPKKPENVTHEVKDGVLIIGIDLAKNLGPSSTGKSDLIGTTHGIIKLDNGVSFSVNAFARKSTS